MSYKAKDSILSGDNKPIKYKNSNLFEVKTAQSQISPYGFDNNLYARPKESGYYSGGINRKTEPTRDYADNKSKEYFVLKLARDKTRKKLNFDEPKKIKISRNPRNTLSSENQNKLKEVGTKL